MREEGYLEKDFPNTPIHFTDEKNRNIDIKSYNYEFEKIVRMYKDFNPLCRSHGIPPIEEEKIRRWLNEYIHIGDTNGYNTLAWHRKDIVGHCILEPKNHNSFELAIFVRQDYQNAGIGTQLVKGLLGNAESDGIRKIWLVVEKWNKKAIKLYKKVGFKTVNSKNGELEMIIKLN